MANIGNIGGKVYPIIFGANSPGGTQSGEPQWLQGDNDGNLFTKLVTANVASGSAVELESERLNDDDVLNIGEGLLVIGAQYSYNDEDARFQRDRNNTTPNLLASAARTVTTNSSVFTNYNARGAHFIINFTASGGVIDLDPIIQAEIPAASGTFYDILPGTNITATGIIVLKVYPGIATIAGGAASDLLPRDYRFRMVHNNGNSQTYSVDAALVV